MDNYGQFLMCSIYHIILRLYMSISELGSPASTFGHHVWAMDISGSEQRPPAKVTVFVAQIKHNGELQRPQIPRTWTWTTSSKFGFIIGTRGFVAIPWRFQCYVRKNRCQMKLLLLISSSQLPLYEQIEEVFLIGLVLFHHYVYSLASTRHHPVDLKQVIDNATM